LTAVASICLLRTLIREGSRYPSLSRMCGIKFLSVHCRRNINFQQISFLVSRKDLGINVTTVLVIQAQVLFIFVTGFKNIHVCARDTEFD